MAKALRNVRESAAAQSLVPLWPVMIVLYATLLPREIRFSAGALSFYSDRIALIVVLPWVILRIFKGGIRFVPPDFLVLASSLWMIVAMIANYGAARGLTSGGAVAIDATVGYFLARLSFRSLTDLRRALIYFSPAIFLAGFSMMLESISHREIVRPMAEAIFGPLPAFLYEGSDRAFRPDYGEIRLGLLRAAGPFSHPILGGLYLASVAAIYQMSGIKGWPLWLGRIASFFSIFSVSSAAISALSLNYVGVAFDKIQRHVRELSWSMIIAGFGVLLFVIEMGTKGGAIGIVSNYLVLNSATAYYRQLIWTYGSASVMNHPLFGIGFEGYERPFWMVSQSIDAHWLLLAVRYGLIPSVTLLLATVMAIVALAKASQHVGPTDQRFYRGIAISLFSLALMMFTVTLWGGALSWFNMLLGACVACAQRAYGVGFTARIVSDAKQAVPLAPAPRRPSPSL